MSAALRSAVRGTEPPDNLDALRSSIERPSTVLKRRTSPAANELAMASRSAFLEALIISVERGPLRQLATDLDDLRDLVSSDVYNRTKADLADLAGATRMVRDGELPLASLSKTIADYAIRLHRLVGPVGEGDFDHDQLSPPLTPGGDWAPGTLNRPSHLR